MLPPGRHENALAPWTLASLIEDAGDGTYEFQVLAGAAGSALVVVDVEGTVLSDQPIIDY